MNSIIAKSKIRQKILKFLFANEEKSFYLSEIAKIAGTSAGNAQREMNRLQKEGVVKSEKRGNLRYFELDKENSAFSDIENIVKKTIGVEAELAEIFGKLKRVDFAFIFGSYAKDELRSGSDIDVVVIGDPDEEELNRKISLAEKSIGREINYHLYSFPEFKKKIKRDSFLKNIVRKYILLSGDKNELKKLLR
ncbi:MAG: archaellum operon transcriptional activator EarA family protein [Candidatus Moranbacteria bacterium]|nr:archaellum operon transcriptional activator EarA family protein [Candidatus Moranbacteria bacterium]